MTMTLDDVRNLDPDEITAIDRQVLRDHKEELTEDEVLRYQSFLEESPKKDDDEEDVDDGEEEKKEGEDEEKKEDDEVEEKKEEKTEVVEEKFSKDEVQKMINEAVAKITPSITKEEKNENKVEIKKFIPEDWDPKGWDEVLDKAVEYVEFKRAEATQKAKSEFDMINDALTAEIDELRAAGEPIPAKGTKEYIELDKQLTEIGIKYKIPSFALAYDVYKKIQPKEDVKPEKEEVIEKKDDAKENKIIAKKIGNATLEVGKTKDDKSYKAIRGKTPRQIVSQFMDELE